MTKDEILKRIAEGKDSIEVVRNLAREALAQPEQDCIVCEGNPKEPNNPCFHCGRERQSNEQEPVAWVCHGVNGEHDVDFDENEIDALPVGTMLYTTPPQRKPLTDEMKKQCPYTAYPSQQAAFMEGWLKAEAAHGIKE